MSNSETQVNKRRTNVVRREFDQSYLDPNSKKSALVTGDGLEPGEWMDPTGTIHQADDDPLEAYK